MVKGVFDSFANEGRPASGARYLVNPFDERLIQIYVYSHVSTLAQRTSAT
jgi:hypothetical protein